MPEMEWEIFNAPYAVCQYDGCGFETDPGDSGTDEYLESLMLAHYREQHPHALDDQPEGAAA